MEKHVKMQRLEAQPAIFVLRGLRVVDQALRDKGIIQRHVC